jgi:hypothetical protein
MELIPKNLMSALAVNIPTEVPMVKYRRSALIVVIPTSVVLELR